MGEKASANIKGNTKIIIDIAIIYYITQFKHSESLLFPKTVITNIKKYQISSRTVRFGTGNKTTGNKFKSRE
jgi:hypothetical protein